MATRRRRHLARLAVTLPLAVLAPAAPGDAQTPTDPVQVCAALEGTPGHASCLEAFERASPEVAEPPATSVSGRDLSEQNLEEQRELLKYLLVGTLVVVGAVITVAWVRSSRRVKQGLPEEINLVIDRLVPPEVRVRRPDARAVRGATTAERRLLRGQLAITAAACALPVAVTVSYVRTGGPGAAMAWVGEHLTLVFAVGAPIVVAWTYRRVKRAGRAGDERWQVLGLETVQTPSFVLVPRGYGGARALPTGGHVLEGVRCGRRVRIEQRQVRGGLLQRTTVHGVDRPDGPVWVDHPGGPGHVVAAAADGAIVVERTIGDGDVDAPETPGAFVRDLALAEAYAAQLAPR